MMLQTVRSKSTRFSLCQKTLEDDEPGSSVQILLIKIQKHYNLISWYSSTPEGNFINSFLYVQT